ncbi:MAG: response regulator [candidate division NC10 bacterium]|nr:response regulator [candidate division NC10 bacterium]MDE2483928.1 response regulator [candidate division NC10 bacterium]
MVDPSLDGSKLFRVLVADDSSEIRELLFEALSSIECSVTCVKDGLEALASLQAGTYDLLITDYQMPRLDGLTLLRYLRTGDCCPPSILITAQSSPDLIKEAKQTGATFVLLKPVAISYLLSLVKTMRAQQPEG